MPLSSYKSVKAFARNRAAARKAAQHAAITHVSMFSMSSFDADRDLPIVYSHNYNIHLFNLELLHHFDTKKYRKLAQHLSIQFLDTRWPRHLLADEHAPEGHSYAELPLGRSLRYLQPTRAISLSELRNHHAAELVAQVHEEKSLLARVFEVWLLNLVPRCWLESRLIGPIKWQISGTIFAANLALQHGWAVNLGGGFHGASAGQSENFCLFSDVMLAIRYIWRKHPLQRFLIIDLDAHQAIGLARDLARLPEPQRQMIFLLDIFNNTIQPADTEADAATNLRIELARFAHDQVYLSRLQEALEVAFSVFKPSLVIYLAGQDVLRDDALGLMALSDAALFRRDELVFRHAVEQHKCPIAMLLAGGYLTRATHVQAQSIRRLYALGLIWGGHRSGSRTLTRPRLSPQSDPASSPSNASSSSPAPPNELATSVAPEANEREAQLAANKLLQMSTRKSMDTIGTHPLTAQHTEPPPSQGFAVLLRKTLSKTLKTADGLEHPVDAVSESISTSGGLHRVRKVVRVAPKAAHITKLLPISAQPPALKSVSHKRRLEHTKKTVTREMGATTSAENKTNKDKE